ncbi:MAG TPA: hypothetical protein VEI07_13545 [Planctomycetaceae bacterium]|nr:hypothetical protein [Planctomycetaceae bacterium]
MSEALKGPRELFPRVANTQGHLPFGLPLELRVDDPDTIRELLTFHEGEPRDRFALNALRIGVLALKQARGQIDADLVRRESERLLTELNDRLGSHAQIVHDCVADSLKQYFDPKDGRLQERIDRLIGRDGELESLLRRQIGDQDLQLAKTLSAHVGAESPLMRVLNPDQSRGVLAAIRDSVEQQLRSQREQVLNQFSLDNKDGALSRFISELSEQQSSLSGELNVKIDRVVREFTLDEKDSALSKLVHRVDDAHQKIASQFSLDNDGSALARMKSELQSLINEHRQDSQRFQSEIREVLAAMATRRQEMQRSTRHGAEFDQAAFAFLQHEAQGKGDIATAVGATTGLIKNCKKGDAVIELGPESAAPGQRIVIEAKEEQQYQLADAREYIETARQNRGALVGVFVYSKRTAPEGMEPLQRLGNDIFVAWDAEDPLTDPYFRAALLLARAMCVRQRIETQAVKVDFSEIEQAILMVEKQSGSLEEVERWTKTIQSSSEKILERIRVARTAFERQVALLSERTDALKSALPAEG